MKVSSLASAKPAPNNITDAATAIAIFLMEFISSYFFESESELQN
jgi:hypothetical protein